MKILELIDSPEKWTRLANARNANNSRVEIDDSSACRWCVRGALLLLDNYNNESMDRLSAAAHKLWPERGLCCAVDVNDMYIKDYAEFRQWIEAAGL